MKHLFYLLGILALLYEATVIGNPGKYADFFKRSRKKKYSDYSDSEKTFLYLNLGYSTWAFIGIFTSQWPLFLILQTMGVFIRKRLKWVTWIDAVLSFLIILFIILNRYHFHIDLIGLL